MKFEWDDEKNIANFRKHGVWFEEGQTVWADEKSQEFFDPDNSDSEDRFIRVGHSTKPRLLLVVFCEREEGSNIRIISARKATKEEEKNYEEGI
ncbi:MAG: hypothetical protein A3B70_08205 [Deltaproteobacteria bacterium RIFCSPHIGHO2_02_FULL_40_11]|nr:MAG: hypothetical protein A3B70_08205 [Deltaproteobacteria bacterium RIFCSPHIGHO2_02_FULL_40_11]